MSINGSVWPTCIDSLFLLVLTLVCAMFLVVRVACFPHLTPGDVQDVGLDKVQVVLTHPKGGKCQEECVLAFERLALVPPGHSFALIRDQGEHGLGT